MGALKLILRFRELTPGVDTIEDHIKILTANGYVWWGWWKKESEPNYVGEVTKMAKQLSVQKLGVLLIDTSAERMHAGSISKISVGNLSSEERKFVPEYYRDSEHVHAWFRIDQIEKDIKYRPNIEKIIGQATMALLDDLDE